MDENRTKKLLRNILDAILSIDEHLQGEKDFNLYLPNKTMRRSLERELEIIGEATNDRIRIHPSALHLLMLIICQNLNLKLKSFLLNNEISI